MSISRRKFLITTAILNTSALYCPSALSCFWGFSFYFSRILPSDFVSASKDEHGVDKFLDRKYGRDTWKYSSPSLSIHVPEIAENAAVIPVDIRSEDADQVGRYQSIVVFVERSVDVLDSEKFSPSYLPSVYHVAGENWEAKNHPNALQIHKITYPMSMMFHVAEFKLGDHTIPGISMRLRNLDGRGMRVIAVFIPTDGSQKIVVAKQENITKTPGCSNTIYVDGKWPEGLKSSYEYQ